VNIIMNDFFGNILQNTFHACCYILLLGTRPKPVVLNLSWFVAPFQRRGSENCYSVLLMSKLMYSCEIRKATLLCAFFDISLGPLEINY